MNYVTQCHRCVGCVSATWAQMRTRLVCELCGGAGIKRHTDPVTITLQLLLVCNFKTGAI